MVQSNGKRGFASMTKEKRREIAVLGGRAAHALGKAHKFTSDEAREAGRKGGFAVSKNRLHMKKIGRAGGVEKYRKAADPRDSASVADRIIGAAAPIASDQRGEDLSNYVPRDLDA